jgi:hypothetical protein
LSHVGKPLYKAVAFGISSIETVEAASSIVDIGHGPALVLDRCWPHAMASSTSQPNKQAEAFSSPQG